MRKLKDQDPEPDHHLWLTYPDPGGPKTCGSGSGSPTLLFAALTFSFVLQDLRRHARVLTILPFVWRGWPIKANSTSDLENIEEYQYNILNSKLRKMSETMLILYWSTAHLYWYTHVTMDKKSIKNFMYTRAGGHTDMKFWATFTLLNTIMYNWHNTVADVNDVHTTKSSIQVILLSNRTGAFLTKNYPWIFFKYNT